MTVTEILAKASMNTLLGMGTVFVVLVFISGIISLFQYMPDKRKLGQKSEAESSMTAGTEKTTVKQADDDQLIAVITAAVAAYCAADRSSTGENGTETEENPYIVRSIRRIGK